MPNVQRPSRGLQSTRTTARWHSVHIPSTSRFVVRSYRGRRCAAAEQRLRKVMFVELRVTKDPFADEASSLVVARSTADDLGEPDNLRKAPPQAEKGGAMFHFVFIVLE